MNDIESIALLFKLAEKLSTIYFITFLNKLTEREGKTYRKKETHHLRNNRVWSHK